MKNKYPFIKHYGLTQEEISQYLGFNSVKTFQSSKKYRLLVQGIEDILKYATNQAIKNIQP